MAIIYSVCFTVGCGTPQQSFHDTLTLIFLRLAVEVAKTSSLQFCSFFRFAENTHQAEQP